MRKRAVTKVILPKRGNVLYKKNTQLRTSQREGGGVEKPKKRAEEKTPAQQKRETQSSEDSVTRGKNLIRVPRLSKTYHGKQSMRNKGNRGGTKSAGSCQIRKRVSGGRNRSEKSGKKGYNGKARSRD